MQLNIISFNIRCIDDPNGHSIVERAPRLHVVTSRYGADIIGFQEYRPAWKEHIARLYGDDFDIFNVYRSTTDPESTPILWRKTRFDDIQTGNFWLSDTPKVESKGWDTMGYERMCTYVTLKEKQTGECITFINTHFGFGDDGQIKSADLIAEYAKRISDYPTVIVGDFNMKPTDPAYAQMTRHFTDANAVTAKDWRNTYHGYSFDETDMHIDYAFVNDGIEPVSQTMMRDTFDGKFPSDHYGLHMVLKTK